MITNQQASEAPSKTNLPSGSSSQPDAASASATSFPAAGAAPHAHALDGSQFHNVIEEQTWSDLPPTQEEQMPRRARHLDDAEREQAPHPEQAQISVGPA